MTAPIWLRRTGRTLNNNSTSILSAAAVGGVIVTAVLAAKAAGPAKIKADEAAEDKMIQPATLGVPFTRMDLIRATWKCYVPTAVAGLATIGCIVGANQIGLRKQAAMLGAYTLADTAFREYKEEVVGLLGEKKHQAITDEVAKKKIEENPPTDNQIIILGGEEQICHDTLSGRYFRSDIETIRRAANNVNDTIIKDMYAPLNEFYSYLGLEPTVLGNEMGFNLEHLIDITFTSALTPKGVPCLAVTFNVLPTAEYTKF